jgi:hypothetical protein
MKLTIHLHTVARLRKIKAIPPLLHTPITSAQGQFHPIDDLSFYLLQMLVVCT